MCGAGGEAGGHQLHQEGSDAEGKQGERLVGHPADQAPEQQGEGEAGADRQERAPEDVVAPEQATPAVGGHLRHGVEGHGFGEGEEGEEDADQHQAAGHAEDAGEEGGAEHHAAEQEDGEGRHEVRDAPVEASSQTELCCGDPQEI